MSRDSDQIEVARNCLEQLGEETDLVMGEVVRGFSCLAGDTYQVGKIVLMKKEIGSKETYTVEIPMTPEWIDAQKERGSGLYTHSVIVDVPAEYLREVRQ